MIRIFWFLLLFLFNPLSQARGQDYPAFRDKAFTSHTSQAQFEQYRISLAVYWEGTLNTSLVDGDFQDAGTAVLAYAHARALPTHTPCKFALENIDVYEIDVATINDHARVNGWTSPNSKVDSIWGLYDSYPFTAARAVILLTDHGSRINRILIAHEMAHYWYDQFCWGADWDGTSETFAMSFQDFYIKNYVDRP